MNRWLHLMRPLGSWMWGVVAGASGRATVGRLRLIRADSVTAAPVLAAGVFLAFGRG